MMPTVFVFRRLKFVANRFGRWPKRFIAASIFWRVVGRTLPGSLKKRERVGREIPLATENSSMVRIRAEGVVARAFMESSLKCYVRKNCLIRTIDIVVTF